MLQVSPGLFGFISPAVEAVARQVGAKAPVELSAKNARGGR
jgi:hypothetical protein